MHDEGGHAVASAVEARGGFLGKPTLAVLIVSMTLTADYLLSGFRDLISRRGRRYLIT